MHAHKQNPGRLNDGGDERKQFSRDFGAFGATCFASLRKALHPIVIAPQSAQPK
jgi:hypothetical protein